MMSTGKELLESQMSKPAGPELGFNDYGDNSQN